MAVIISCVKYGLVLAFFQQKLDSKNSLQFMDTQPGENRINWIGSQHAYLWSSQESV